MTIKIKKVSFLILSSLKRRGELGKFARKYGLPRTSLYKSVQRGTDWTRRPRMSQKKAHPWWKYVPPSAMEGLVTKTINSARAKYDLCGIEIESLKDLLRDTALTTSLRGKQHPISYLAAVLRSKVRDWRRRYENKVLPISALLRHKGRYWEENPKIQL